MNVLKYSQWDFLFTSAGLPLFLFDIVMDVLAAVNFYKEEAYLCLAVLLVLLIGSSVLAQLYSWLWYSYDEFKMETKLEDFLKPILGVLHMFQLGMYIRHLAVLEAFMPNSNSNPSWPTDVVVYMNHDLNLLRFMETFWESAPQIVLMLTVIMQEGKPGPITVLKTICSLSTVAFCVTTYHRCLRSFLPDKKKQPIISSIVYFLWNLLLLSSRIVALALFASEEPCFIFTHFFCSWLVLFFFAWCSKTKLMDSAGGEWLYRATVGLIWYFDWFNVVEGQMRKQMIVYHTYILVDISVLCGVWYWKMSLDPPPLEISCLQAVIISGAVVSVYIMGLICKIIYYLFFHPKLYKKELIGDIVNERQGDEVDFGPRASAPGVAPVDNTSDVLCRIPCMPSGLNQQVHCNKRTKKLAENFYSRSVEGVEA
ncbi:XK-related protein 8-like [Girardinichthys multiradiatus]|uniref:XK-related protein 8-like n=1 Tax=Girardinichthys multiradiatus TaxID=208333 RepID=UPI001FAC567D|nr:XK-related protein 8-like [Girardinichthys multiradiatus]